jgi:hypothetical protein
MNGFTAGERMAPGHVYNPVTGTGIAWQPGVVQLWDRGQVVAEAAHTTAAPWDFWYGLGFAAAFPQITHWWFDSAWTGKVWVRLIGTQTRGRTTVIMGGMRFIDRAEPEQTWQVILADAQEPWPTGDGSPAPVPVLVGVPLPPFAVQPGNLALRCALATLVFDLVQGTRAAALTPDEEMALRAVIGAVDLGAVPAAAGQAVLTEAGLHPAQAAAVLERGPTPDWITTVLDVVSPPAWATSLVAAADLAAAFPTTGGAWRLEQVDRPLRAALCDLQGLVPPAAAGEI